MNTSGAIVCLRKGDEVFFQNSLSKQSCGDGEEAQCAVRCLPLLDEAQQKTLVKTGMLLLENQEIQGKVYDVFTLKDGEITLTILTPLEDQQKELMNKWEKIGLSPRESEVLYLKSKGHTNKEIAEKLFVSKSTIKTHLNNIYKKLSNDDACAT